MKKLWGSGQLNIAALSFLAILAVVGFVNGDSVTGCIAIAFSAVFAAGALVLSIKSEKRLKRIVMRISSDLSSGESNILNDLKIPVMVSSRGEFVWYNREFEQIHSDASAVIGQKAEAVFGAETIEKLELSGSGEISIENRIFKLYSSVLNRSDDELEIFYLIDQTKLYKTLHKYEKSRPVVAIITLDNIDEITKSAKDSEIAAFKSSIQNLIEKWIGKTDGIGRRFSGDRYILILEERHFAELMEEKFSILRAVRELKFNDQSATLSIGVGRQGKNLQECEEFALQALDMALGRGGDQAVIKMPDNEYKFFGGVAGSVERRTKVKSRIISSALKEMVGTCDRVIVMGHRFSDLDSVGASYGIYSMLRSMEKEAHIVVDRNRSMAKLLLNRIESMDKEVTFTNGNDLLPFIDNSTLLIVVDVHRPQFVENPDILKLCKNVVVIDHHRKAVDYIEKAAIFYNEPAASSSSEMVTEMLEYISPRSVRQIEAEALLSGIMLDSRNYVLRTGVRTFEASAFLRNHGADPVSVKKLFSGTMPAYKQRANIVASAQLYSGDCAIAVNRESDENTKLATSQAADELLGISGVLGSFVICRQENEVNISARSLGNINVQLIMESLGGGGHRTMAACQLKNCDLDSAREKLQKAIDEYKENV